MLPDDNDYNGIPETDLDDLGKGRGNDPDEVLPAKSRSIHLKSPPDHRTRRGAYQNSGEALIENTSSAQKRLSNARKKADDFLQAISTNKAIERLEKAHFLAAADTSEEQLSPLAMALAVDCGNLFLDMLSAAKDFAAGEGLETTLVSVDQKLAKARTELSQVMSSGAVVAEDRNFLKELMAGLEFVQKTSQKTGLSASIRELGKNSSEDVHSSR